MVAIESISARTASFLQCKSHIKDRFGVTKLVRLGFEYDPSRSEIVCSRCQFVWDRVLTDLDTIFKEHKKFSANCQYADIAAIKSVEDTFKQLKVAINGKDPPSNSSSFKGNSDKNQFVSKSSSTSDYFTMDSNLKVGTLSWNNSRVEHSNVGEINLIECMKTVSPSLLKVLNSALERHTKGFSNNVEQSDDTDSGRGATASALNGQPTVTSVEIQQQAKHPGLSTREERRRTFRGQEQKYSHSIHHNIIDRLVEAGLYYVGPTDNVRCFFCDGGLKNFSRDDEPFTEHKKWFTQCKYVMYVEQTKRAEGLVRDAVDARDARMHIQESAGNVTAATSLNRPLHDGDVDFMAPKKVLESREVKARLELPIYAKLQEMGYQKDHIRQAIEFRFATYGDDYTSVEEIIKDILRIQGDGALPLNKRSGAEAIRVTPTRTTQPEGSTQSSTSHDNPDGSSARVSPIVSQGPSANVSSIQGLVTRGSANNVSAAVRTPSTTQATRNLQGAATVAAASSVSRGTANGQAAAAADIISDNDPAIQHLTKEAVVAALKDQPITDTELTALFREFEQSTHIRTCQVCLVNEITTVFLPCGHYVCCNTCTTRLTHCCICRSLIRGTVKALTSREKN